VELQVRLQLLPTAVFAAAALELSGATTATSQDIANAGQCLACVLCVMCVVRSSMHNVTHTHVHEYAKCHTHVHKHV